MRRQQFHGILLLTGIIMSGILYNAAVPKTSSITPELHQVRLTYDVEKIQLQRETLRRNDHLKFYGIISVLAGVNLSFLIIAGGIARARIRAASLCTAHIGQHSSIPIRYKDLPQFYQIAVNLSLAELEASSSQAHDQAYQVSRQMIEDITNYTRVLAGKRGLFPGTTTILPSGQLALPQTGFSVPSFAELLRNGTVGPGTPLVMGYACDMSLGQGQPQYRELQDLKSVAVAGWQGSGKTLSMGSLIASSVLAYDVHVYVVDPHKHHDESLGRLIQPLTKTGRVTVVNPFDTPRLIHHLNQVLDRRLSGKESSHPGILLVIDELARLAKMECFDELLRFLERCTEETRKANITFIGSSPKWTARHFKGRADIRGCMNSMLIHKAKPSQAELLLEDAHDKKLVKQLHHPGEAILVTDYASPVVVRMPCCCRQDMETVAAMVGAKNAGETTKRREAPQQEPAPQQNMPPEAIKNPENRRKSESAGKQETPKKPENAGRPEAARKPEAAKPSKSATNMIFIGKHQHPAEPEQLTVEQIRAQILYRKQQNPKFTQAEVARQAGLSPSLLSGILNGRSALTSERKQMLYSVLFQSQQACAANH